MKDEGCGPFAAVKKKHKKKRNEAHKVNTQPSRATESGGDL